MFLMCPTPRPISGPTTSICFRTQSKGEVFIYVDSLVVSLWQFAAGTDIMFAIPIRGKCELWFLIFAYLTEEAQMSSDLHHQFLVRFVFAQHNNLPHQKSLGDRDHAQRFAKGFNCSTCSLVDWVFLKYHTNSSISLRICEKLTCISWNDNMKRFDLYAIHVQ